MPHTILITGCSTGIGLASVKLFLEKGYRVFATARKDADLAMLEKLGAEPIFLDLNQHESLVSCTQLVNEKTGGKLDALLNNAAYGMPGTVEDMPMVALRAQFETNVFATLEFTQLCMPMLRASEAARIVFISSMLSYCTMPARSAYCASKYALTSFIAGLRMELRDTPIKVVSIRPGPIATEFRARVRTEFDEHIDGHDTHYTEQYDSLRKQDMNPKKIAFCKPPSAVAEKVYRAVTAKNPRLHYQVTFPAHLFLFLSRILPESALDWMMTRI